MEVMRVRPAFYGTRTRLRANDVTLLLSEGSRVVAQARGARQASHRLCLYAARFRIAGASGEKPDAHHGLTCAVCGKPLLPTDATMYFRMENALMHRACCHAYPSCRCYRKPSEASDKPANDSQATH